MKSSQKMRILNIQPIEFKNYCNVDIDHLTMYAVNILDEKNVDLSFENVVVAAYRLFPQKFSLNGFEEFPDSNRIRNSLNRCTMNKKWLGGKALQGFEITSKSKYIINESIQKLLGSSLKKQKSLSQTRRKESIISVVYNTMAYKKHINPNLGKISMSDICYLLQGTLDTKKTILLENFKTLKLYAYELHDEKVLLFLKKLEEEFKDFFNK